MSTHPRTTGERVAALRTAEGHSVAHMRDELVRRLPQAIVPSEAKLRRFESGRSARVDPITLCAIAAIYGVRLSELDEHLADDLDMVSGLLEQRLRCIAVHPSVGQGVLDFDLTAA